MAADDVTDQILADTSDPHVRLAMAFGALMEGGSLGSGPFGVGDNGTSFGPFQIHLPAHPGVSAAQASDPAFATNYMLADYAGSASAQPASLWASNPELAAEQTAVAAERPAQTYIDARGQAAVDSKYAQAQAALAGLAAGASSNPPGTSATATQTASIVPFLNPLNWPSLLGGAASSVGGSVAGGVAGSVMSVMLPFVTKIAFIGVGGLLVVVGLYRATDAGGKAGAAGQSASQLAPLAALAL
jgi:hypothetical protein